MALSGLEIFKLLPKTNCGDCGVPTCMAFAMKLAQKKAELGECPHASDEAKETLGAAGEPPIRLIKIGGANALEVGNETVMFRHEKTFYHPTGIAVELRTSEGKDKILGKIQAVERYVAERVGEEMTADVFFVTMDAEGTGDQFLDAVRLVKEFSRKGVILDCGDPEVLAGAVELVKDERPAIHLRGAVGEGDIELAKAAGASLIIRGEDFDDLERQVEKAWEGGVKDLILNLDAGGGGSAIQNNTLLRRGALRRSFKPFGYPLFRRFGAVSGVRGGGSPGEEAGDSSQPALAAEAALEVCKYGSIVVLPEFDKALLYTLFTLRQNIYTDPQKPIQVDAKVYPIGEPGPESPVFVTTNFSLTYFMVSGEIENSGISAHLVVTDVEGQSVLTAWAAGKFVGETIAKFVKDIGLEEQVRTRKLVIPGFVSQISGDLEDSLPGWQVVVGPREAADIPSFVKSVELT